MIDVVLGLQIGDEGKGKITAFLNKKNNYHAVCRFAGGPNAGHTIYDGNKKIVLHQVPSGILNPKTTLYIGNGCVVDLDLLVKEIETYSEYNILLRLIISGKAHIIMPYHLEDGDKSGEDTRIGSTKRGITPCYRDKVARIGIMIEDLFSEDRLLSKLNLLSQYYPFIKEVGIHKLLTSLYDYRLYFEHNIDTADSLINQYLRNDKDILCEGAQGFELDIDHGEYPYVTSSNSTIGGVFTGLGVPPQYIRRVYGVMKCYTTRVGTGSFPTQVDKETEEILRSNGKEFGATTGRPRKIGWLNLSPVIEAISINGVTDLCVTKVDVLSKLDKVKVLTPNGYGYNEFIGWKNIDFNDRQNIHTKELEIFLNYIDSQTRYRYTSHFKGVTYVSYGEGLDDIKLY